jgi:hypothetical protein
MGWIVVKKQAAVLYSLWQKYEYTKTSSINIGRFFYLYVDTFHVPYKIHRIGPGGIKGENAKKAA